MRIIIKNEHGTTSSKDFLKIIINEEVSPTIISIAKKEFIL
jgi:hypothetical protein